MVLLRLLCCLLLLCIVFDSEAFVDASHRHGFYHHRSNNFRRILMVRNIDLPEAIVLYDVFDDWGVWKGLIKQCKEMKTPVISIESNSGRTNTRNSPPIFDGFVVRYEQESPPPSPKDLLKSIGSVHIQPEPFGGSSGFASVQTLEPGRPPLPCRTVVFGRTEDHSRAARLAGMRVLSLQDNDLVDAVLLDIRDVQDLWLEDIATPGSYWLNPPHARDDEGNKVDPEQLILWYDNPKNARKASKTTTTTTVNRDSDGEELSDETNDDEISRILADLSPL